MSCQCPIAGSNDNFLKLIALRYFGKHQGFRDGARSGKPDVANRGRTISSWFDDRVQSLSSIPLPVPYDLSGTVFIALA